VVAKVAVAWLLVRMSGLEVRPLQLAVGLGQIGEFSFVLASTAVSVGAIEPALYVALIAAVAISITVSSVAVRYLPPGVRRPDHAAAA